MLSPREVQSLLVKIQLYLLAGKRRGAKPTMLRQVVVVTTELKTARALAREIHNTLLRASWTFGAVIVIKALQEKQEVICEYDKPILVRKAVTRANGKDANRFIFDECGVGEDDRESTERRVDPGDTEIAGSEDVV